MHSCLEIASSNEKMYRGRIKGRCPGVDHKYMNTDMYVSFDRSVKNPVICEFAQSMDHYFSGERGSNSSCSQHTV